MTDKKPEYAINLERRMDKLERSVKESKLNQDNILVTQDKTLDVVNEIHILLAGTEYERDQVNGHGGGMVKRFSRVEKCVDVLNVWKIQMVTRSVVIWSTITIAVGAIWTIIITNWDKIFS